MIGFFEYQYLKYKKEHLKNLLALAKSDGHLDDTEIEFLYVIGKRYGLKERQIQVILASEEEHKIKIPDGYAQRVGQLYDIVGMMMADNIIEQNEMDFCEQMCRQMQLDKRVIQDMVLIYERGGVQDFEEWEDFVEKWKKHQLN